MSYTVPVVHKTYTLSPTLLSLRPVPITLSTVTTTVPTVTFEVAEPKVIKVETSVQEPKVTKTVETKVENSFPVTTTTVTTTTTETTKEYKVPQVISTCLWSHGPINFYEIQQLEKK